MTFDDPVQQIVLNFLNHFAYQDAIFLSERLHAEYKTEESLYLLALSHYRSGSKSLRAYHILKERLLKLPKSRYLLAKCCLDLNKYGEAESVLISNLPLKSDPSVQTSSSKYKLYDEIVKEYGPEYSPHVLQILANVYCKTDRISQAFEFYKKSLRLNPFMWSSFDSVCTLGEKVDLSKFFTVTSALNAYSTIDTNSNCLNTLNNVTNQQLNVNNNTNISNNVQQNFQCSQSQNTNQQFTNVLKQQNDLQNLDQKCKHDISAILRLVEQDQQNKFLNSFNNSSTFKENALSNQSEETTPNSNSQSAQLITTTATTQVQTTCNCEAKLNQTLNQSNANTSQSTTSGVSLSTPVTQPNSSNILTLAPPQKKVVIKRIPSHKPLFGQNTTNNLSSSNSTSAQTSGTQKPIKSKTKSSSSTSIISTTTQDQPMDESPNESQETEIVLKEQHEIKSSNRIKIKKTKLKTKRSKMDNCEQVTETTPSNETTEQKQYADCRDCNLLSNQSKNLTLNTYSTRKNKFNLICLENLMKLLKDLAHAYYNLKQFECEKALEYFEQLPESQLNSSFVLTQMAKAHFELHNYTKSEKLYLQLRREYPYHLEGLEYYSTTLWHLQKEIALSSLAQELTEFDKLAPETWCAVGNCFSLHKEHDAAIKFFHRAAQVDPKFTYAYNLLGHEYVLIEEMDKGLSSFRKAIFLDPRHYNAWYGISMIHFKQEKFLLAEKYLKKALLINPHSSTLMVHIAVVYHSLKQSEKALQILDRALEIEPKNTLVKFHRASILFAMEKYEEALEEYEKLRRLIPKESLIYYMISKTHKKLKNVHLSLMYMSWAMDLDPKGVNNQLKESVDKRYVIDSDSTFARELETINTSTLDAIYGGNEILQTNDEEDQDLDDLHQGQQNNQIDQSNNDENNNTNNLTNNDSEEEDEDDEEDLMDNDETRNEEETDRFSLKHKFKSQEEESDEDEDEDQDDDDQDDHNSDSTDEDEDDDDDQKPNPSSSQGLNSKTDIKSKETDPSGKRSQDSGTRSDNHGSMDAEQEDDDEDEPKTVISNSDKLRPRKSKRIEFQKRQENDDSENDADDKIEDKEINNKSIANETANTSASFVLINDFKSSTYTPETSMLPIMEHITAAPKSKKKPPNLPTNKFHEAFSFKKSLQMNKDRHGNEEILEDEDEVYESDLMSTTIDTTKNDTIPFLNQSQMSINKSIQSGAQLNINNNKHLSFNQTSTSIQDQLMDSVEEDL